MQVPLVAPVSSMMKRESNNVQHMVFSVTYPEKFCIFLNHRKFHCCLFGNCAVPFELGTAAGWGTSGSKPRGGALCTERSNDVR